MTFDCKLVGILSFGCGTDCNILLVGLWFVLIESGFKILTVISLNFGKYGIVHWICLGGGVGSVVGGQ